MLIAQSVESILSQVDYKVFFYNVLQKELLCSHIVICILTHQRHGGIPIVVQRALEVREVIFKTSKVNFMTYVKCQCDGNNPRRWVFGFLGEEINAFKKNPNEIPVPKAYVGGLV